jgi:hypothetical protein
MPLESSNSCPLASFANAARRMLRPIAGAGLSLMIAGCAHPKPWQYGVRVSVAEPLKSVEVNLIGVDERESRSWRNKDVAAINNYWADEAGRKTNNPIILLFDENTRTHEVKPSDDKLTGWRKDNVLHLVIVEDSPPVVTEPGREEFRRDVIPFDSNAWDTEKKILEIVIDEKGIKVITPEPKKKFLGLF